MTARNEEALRNCVAEIEEAGSEALAVRADCTDQGEVERVVAQAVERFGRLDAYVANAIVTVYAGAINTPQFDRDRQKIGYQPQRCR